MPSYRTDEPQVLRKGGVSPQAVAAEACGKASTAFPGWACVGEAGGENSLSLWGGFWLPVLAALPASGGVVLGCC